MLKAQVPTTMTTFSQPGAGTRRWGGWGDGTTTASWAGPEGGGPEEETSQALACCQTARLLTTHTGAPDQEGPRARQGGSRRTRV